MAVTSRPLPLEEATRRARARAAVEGQGRCAARAAPPARCVRWSVAWERALTLPPPPAAPNVCSAWRERLAAQLERLQSSAAAGPSGGGGVGGGEALKPCCAKKAAAAAAAVAASAIPRPIYGPMEASVAALDQLARLFEPSRLAEQTALLEPGGRRLREGASILLSATPGGALLVQGARRAPRRAAVGTSCPP